MFKYIVYKNGIKHTSFRAEDMNEAIDEWCATIGPPDIEIQKLSSEIGLIYEKHGPTWQICIEGTKPVRTSS
jgi:hypothetical protein